MAGNDPAAAIQHLCFFANQLNPLSRGFQLGESITEVVAIRHAAAVAPGNQDLPSPSGLQLSFRAFLRQVDHQLATTSQAPCVPAGFRKSSAMEPAIFANLRRREGNAPTIYCVVVFDLRIMDAKSTFGDGPQWGRSQNAIGVPCSIFLREAH